MSPLEYQSCFFQLLYTDYWQARTSHIVKFVSYFCVDSGKSLLRPFCDRKDISSKDEYVSRFKALFIYILSVNLKSSYVLVLFELVKVHIYPLFFQELSV